MRDRYDRRYGRNDRGSVFPPDRTDYQGQRGLTSYANGLRFAEGAAAARLVFDTDHEILSLAGTQIQAASIANEVPSIAGPATDTGHLLSLMRQGCFLRVAHGSAFPVVLIRDGEDPNWQGAGRIVSAAGTEVSFHPRQLVVDQSGIWCPPCSQPMILPPTSRYIAGFHTAVSSYPIGGRVTGDTDAGIQWYVYLEASSEPFASGPRPTIYSGFFPTLVTTAGSDLTINTPTFPTKWSEPRDGIKTYRGCHSGQTQAGQALVAVAPLWLPYDHDSTNLLATSIGPGAISATSYSSDLPQAAITCYWWSYRWTLDYDDPTESVITANFHFQIEL